MDLPTTFADIKPIPQDDGPEPVCSISYSQQFVQAYDYLRAVMKIDERSERTFNLTTVCLKLNPANYTVWHFRRRCLIALTEESRLKKNPSINDGGGDGGPGVDGTRGPKIDVELIEKDLDFADALGGTNPKNYQLWYHRRALLEIHLKSISDENSEGLSSLGGDGKEKEDSGAESDGEEDERLPVARAELDYVDKILGDDSKNYHAWSHRQWLIRTINHPKLWSSEIEYSHSQILSDPRNNSAWNERWFATHEGRRPNQSKESMKRKYRGNVVISMDKAREEASYALCGTKVDPFNESPWRYLVGILMEQWRWAQISEDEEEISDASALLREYITQIREMKQSCEEQPFSENEPPLGPCPNLISALVDILMVFSKEKDFLSEALQLLGVLETEDPIRRKYWQKRGREVSALLKELEQSA